MKNQRQIELIRIISDNVVSTQEDLLAELRDLGYNVTQATISRDMRELKITKTADSNGTLRYTVSTPTLNKKAMISLNSALTESIIKIDSAHNDIVIRTLPGLAQAIAAAIDSLHLENVLGCVAGDDTILMITRDVETATDICLRLRELLSQ